MGKHPFDGSPFPRTALALGIVSPVLPLRNKPTKPLSVLLTLEQKMPQTPLRHGALSLVAPPLGVAHLSDALGAEVVAWITAPVAASRL